VSGEHATVTVTRNLPSDVGQRQIYVSLDGERVATLLFGQSVTREIAPGRHRIRANNTLVWKTLSFDVAPGEHVDFVLANRAGRGSFSALAIMGVGPLFLTFERVLTRGTSSRRTP
jgi:hypothetical protein